MAPLQRATLAVVLACCAALAAWDLYAYGRGGWPATVSYLVLTRARRHPILAVAVGVLIGHLFWPQPEPPDDEPTD